MGPKTELWGTPQHIGSTENPFFDRKGESPVEVKDQEIIAHSLSRDVVSIAAFTCIEAITEVTAWPQTF